jgi:hypothetical protein
MNGSVLRFNGVNSVICCLKGMTVASLGYYLTKFWATLSVDSRLTSMVVRLTCMIS